MKRNQSLAQFQNIVVLDLVVGGIAFVIGLIVILLNSGYNLNLQAIGNGIILVYLGSGLLALGVFASLLRLTAASIIEGVAISLREAQGQAVQQGSYLSAPAASTTRERVYKPSANSPVEAPAYVDQSAEAQYSRDSNAWAQRNLSNIQYEWWVELGKPNLMLWVRQGKPDFKEWIQANKR